MQFVDVVGQDKAKAQVLSMVATGRLPHALLLAGPAGVGKLALAAAIAQYVNCEAPTDADSCGVCSSCRKTAGLIHPDVHWVAPIFQQTTGGRGSSTDDHIALLRERFAESPYLGMQQWAEALAAENKQLLIAIHEIRELKRKLQLKAYEGQWKVVLLWHIEKMNNEAANAFLKLLEEPPEHTLLLLTLEEPATLLPTIASRCQRLQVRRLAQPEIQGHLQAQHQVPESQAHELAALADGSLSRALDEMQHSAAPFTEAFQQWMRLCYGGRFAELHKWADEWGHLPKERLKLFLHFALQKLRDTLVTQVGAPTLAYAAEAEKQFLANFAKTTQPPQLDALAHEIEQAAYHVMRNANASLCLLNLSLRIHGILKAKAA